jgi:hypothetical protein
MDTILSDKLQGIRKTRVLFQKMSFDSSNIEFSNENRLSLTRNQSMNVEIRKNSLELRKNHNEKNNVKRFYLSPKIKNFRILEVQNFYQMSKPKSMVKNYLSSTDGFLVHKFSIPNGFVRFRKKSNSFKRFSEFPFISNPNLRNDKKGPSGFKLYKNLKRPKKV